MGRRAAGGTIDENYFELLGKEPSLDMLCSFKAQRRSVKERMEAGRSLRQNVARSSHARFDRTRAKVDPLAVLAKENATRIPKLVPIRMSRMVASPFAFLRGAAGIMATDLEQTPCTGIDVMACGDMHLFNFGLFASAERNLVFAINDFDEVHPGPWEWDLKRLATSATVAAQFLGGDRTDGEEAARSVVNTYMKRIRRYAEMGYLEVWYDLIDEKQILEAAPKPFRDRARAALDKAHARGHIRTLDRLTESIGGQSRIIEDVPLIVRENRLTDGTHVDEALDAMLRAYVISLPDDRRRLLSRYRLIDVARKVVGVGSVGTSCWVLLLEGHGTDDPLFLQVKEARDSVLAPHVPRPLPITHQGKRIVIGQRMIQGSPDIFLGWGPGYDGKGFFYVRQLADMKGGVSFREGNRAEREHLLAYCRLCGWALALAHAKSGDPAMIAGYYGKSDELPDATARFAKQYADQTQRDFDTLLAAVRAGHVEVGSDASRAD